MADIENLIQDLQSDDFETRLAACKQLGDMPDLPGEAIEALREAAGDSDPLIAVSAYQVLEDHISGTPSAIADITSPSQPSPPPNEGTVPACSVCGRQDETLQQVVYPYVVSFLLVTFRRAFAGLWCSKHSTLYLFLASSITATIGWLGIPFGLIFTPLALFKLARGGDQPEEANIQLLSDLAEHKLKVGDSPGAIRCLEVALQIKDDEVIRDRLKELYRTRMLSTSEQGYSPVLLFISVMLGAATIGVTIGILEYLSIVIFKPFIGEEVSIFLTILSWIPLVALAFIGGLTLQRLIAWGLIRAKIRQIALSISLAAIAAFLALYGIAEGKAIGQYVDQVQAGMDFISLSDALMTSGAILTRGGIFTILDAINFMGVAGVIYVLIILVCAVYYFTASVSGAIRITQWQQDLNEIRTEFSTREERSYQSAWISIAGVVIGLALFTGFFLQKDVVGVDAANSHNDHGMDLYEQGEVEQAILEYKEAIHLQPDFAPAHSNLGWAYYYQGNLEAATEEFQIVINLKPDLPYAHQGLGWVYLHQGEMDAAFAAFQKALQLDPTLADAHNGLGWVYFNEGEMPEALDAFQTAVKLEPELANAHEGLGWVNFWMYDLEAAGQAFETALAFGSSDGTVQAGLGVVYLSQDRLQDAENLLATALTLAPDYFLSHYGLGSLYMEKGDFDTAASYFEEAISLNPQYGPSIFGLASIYIGRAEFEEAVEQFQVLNELTPDWGAPHAGLAFAYFQMDKPRLVEQEIQNALALTAEDIYTHSWLGKIYSEMHEFPKAEIQLKKAVELMPNDGYLYQNLADIYTAQKKFSQAHEACDTAMELNPDDSDTYLTRANIFIEEEQLDQAFEELNQADKLSPESWYIHSALSFVYYHQGQLTKALEEAKTAVRLNQYGAKGHANLAFAYHMQGELEQALLSAKEAVRLNPKNEWGHYILGLCYMDEGENEKAITEFETFLELYWDRAYARDYKVQAEEFLAELR